MPFGIVWPGQSPPLTQSLPCNIHKQREDWVREIGPAAVLLLQLTALSKLCLSAEQLQ